jgi:hypothetical protein
VLDLLFELATWHGLAKLRLHTESTLHALDTSTTRLGRILRRFKATTCRGFHTRELPSEKAARGRRDAAAAAKNQTSERDSDRTSKSKASKSQTARTFNLTTYKLHSLGDYVHAIRMYGTSDGFTTQTVRHLAPDATALYLLGTTRASWNIADSNGSTHASTKASSPMGSQSNSGGSDCYFGCVSLHRSQGPLTQTPSQRGEGASTTKRKLQTHKNLDLLSHSKITSRLCPHPRVLITTFQGMSVIRLISWHGLVIISLIQHSR